MDYSAGRRSFGASSTNNFPTTSTGNDSQATSVNNGGGNTGQSDYAEEREKCIDFLSTFQSSLDDPNDQPKYLRMMQEVANRERIAIPIELDDLQNHVTDPEFVHRIARNAKRYIELFSEAIDRNLPAPTRDISHEQDVLDVLRLQRAEEMAEMEQSNNGTTSQTTPAGSVASSVFPPQLMRRFEVQLVPDVKAKPVPIRQVKAGQVGRLVRVKGMVTRVSTVKPLLTVATYTCEACAYEVYQEVKSRQFNPVTTCPSERCQTNGLSGRLILQPKASKFDKFQEVKLQELPDQVPMGHIPRSLSVVLRGELTRSCEPGALITLAGVFLPVPTSAQRQMMLGLVTETYLEATHVINHKKRYAAMESSEEMEDAVLTLQSQGNVYETLSQSLAPEIFGHEDIKKALLLLLIGGVTKRMDEGMTVRGDLNVLLMGDPGVAKSQLLKHIATIAPRGVYTTGKGSSGVGLTAAVVRDTTTREMTLEGGALVLADRGVCCIDEFDKMEDGDRTAIHEVMEQQTVSIAKAGITTTLNARTSVLAAANPLYGRYNKRLSASTNINLPNALLSRFDLLFLLLDVANYEQDEALARHVTYVHRYARNPPMQVTPVPAEVLRYFIAIAKQYEPSVPEHLCGYIVEAYVTLRQQDVHDQRRQNGNKKNFGKSQEDVNQAQTAMTARQLLSILRLSQALARLRFATEVVHQDVDEAIRLVYVSKNSLSDPEDGNGGSGDAVRSRSGADATSRIYRLVLEFAEDHRTRSIPLNDVEPAVLRKGFTQQQLRECIRFYERLEVMQLNATGTTLNLID